MPIPGCLRVLQGTQKKETHIVIFPQIDSGTVQLMFDGDLYFSIYLVDLGGLYNEHHSRMHRMQKCGREAAHYHADHYHMIAREAAPSCRFPLGTFWGRFQGQPTSTTKLGPLGKLW